MKTNENLFLSYKGMVYPWNCDHMGHMNVMWYTGKFDEATWHVFSRIGLNQTFLKANSRGMAAVKQETVYRKEILAGSLIEIHSCVLEMKEKAIRFYHEMINEETGEICATTIFTGVHLDLLTRKSCAFPEEIFLNGQKLTVSLNL